MLRLVARHGVPMVAAVSFCGWLEGVCSFWPLPGGCCLSVTQWCRSVQVQECQYMERGMIRLPAAGVNGSLRFPPRSPVSGLQLVRMWVCLLCGVWTSVEMDLQGLRGFCFLAFSFVRVCVYFVFCLAWLCVGAHKHSERTVWVSPAETRAW